jgi:hypothetical protein
MPPFSLGVSGAAILMGVSLVCSSGNEQPTWAVDGAEESTVRQTAGNFLGIPVEKASEIDVRVRHDEERNTRLWLASTPSMSVVIDQAGRCVLGWNVRSDQLPSRTEDGRVVTATVFEAEIARLSEEDALQRAQTFLLAKFGKELLQSAGSPRTGRRPLGPGYYFWVSWADLGESESGVFIGKTAVDVMVNPVSGEVVSGTVRVNRVTLEPRLLKHEAIDRAFGLLQEVHGALTARPPVVEVRLMQCSVSSGQSELVWFVSFSGTHGVGRGIGGFVSSGGDTTISVLDSSGAVFLGSCSS